MRKLYWSAVLYTVLGLAGGLYYRELTKAKHFSGDTELSVVHTHFLVLGMLVFLLLMVFERVFSLTDRPGFTVFLVSYHVGVLWTVGMMFVIGTRQVLHHEPGDALSGVAGVGHVIITISLVVFFHIVYRSAVRARSSRVEAKPAP